MQATMTKRDDYFHDWYEKNGQVLNDLRRERYHNDPEYREAVTKRNQEARKKRRSAETSEREAEREAGGVVRVAGRLWKAVDVEIEIDGKKVVTRLFTIGALARVLGRSVQAIRLWERQGVLPETPLRNEKGDRLYTAEQVGVFRQLMECKNRLSLSLLRSRPSPQPVRRVVRFKDGHEEELVLFRIGALAEIVGRTVVTLEQLEKHGILPATPFRAASTRYRLYSLPMIQTVKAAFDARNGEIRGKIGWVSFCNDVRVAWYVMGMMDATLV